VGRLALVAAMGMLIAVGELRAQAVAVIGGEGERAVEIYREIIRRDAYLLIDRDTILGPDFSYAGDLVVVDARLALEGRVEGAVAVLMADLFIRPAAVVGGPVAVLGGGAYLSGRAQRLEIAELPPGFVVELDRSPGGLTVVLQEPPRPPTLRFPALGGLQPPTYDRVNGLSLLWGAELASGGEIPRASLRGTVAARSARRRIDGSAELSIRPAQGLVLTALAGSGTRTPDAWVRGDLANSLAALLFRSDVRDYFHSEELAFSLGIAARDALVPGEGYVAPAIRFHASRDSSLETADPWTLFGRGNPWRPNAPIDDGVLASVVGGAVAGWQGASSRFDGLGAVEWAPGEIGDFKFTQLTASASWSMEALWDHQITVGGSLLHPLGRGGAPRQRWSYVGGAGTLPTFPIGVMRGDHLVFVNSLYLAPIPGLHLPLGGRPRLRLEHAVGAAWTTGTPRPPLEQNVGAGIQLAIFHAMLHSDPSARPFRPRLSLGAQLPARGRLSL